MRKIQPSNQRLILNLFLLSVLLISCSQGPKVISLEETLPEKAISNSHHGPQVPGQYPEVDPLLTDDIHIVQILETLPTEQYIYAFVEENGDKFWIASEKTELTLEKKYYYKGSMAQYDFYSREFDRTFDTVYFISQIIPVDHNLANKGRLKDVRPTDQDNTSDDTEVISVSGSTPIAELIKNKESLGGQTIQVSGRCVKVNTEIMGRNWVHIQDGSQNEFDMVVTTNEKVEVGQLVTFSGVLLLDRDFGSGYYYEMIIESGQLIAPIESNAI